MKIKRALGASAYTYIAALAVGIIGAFIFSAEPGQTEMPVGMWLIGLLAPIFFAWIFSLWYFRGSRVAQGRSQGIMLGVTMIIVGFILDILTVLPTAGGFSGAFTILSDYYTQWIFWFVAILVVLTCMLVGGNLREKHRSE